MSFSHHAVASTCTGSHLVGWSIAVSGSKKEQIEGKIRYVDQLIGAGFKLDFKLITATITQSQINSSNGLIEEMMKEIGFTHAMENIGPTSREKGTGRLHLYVIAPEDYKKGLEAYKIKLRAELKDLKKGPLDPKELAERQAKPELLIINLKKQGLIKVDWPNGKTILDTKIPDALAAGRPLETLVAHLRMRYGVDYQEVFEGKFAEATLRQMKQYHADWRSGKVI